MSAGRAERAMGRFRRVFELGVSASASRALARVRDRRRQGAEARRDIAEATRLRAAGLSSIVANGLDPATALDRFHSRCALFAEALLGDVRSLGDARLQTLERECADILEGRMSLLGWGSRDVGHPTRWSRSPIDGHEWPSGLYGPAILPPSYPGGSDPKAVWEIGRSHHVVMLAAGGQAIDDAALAERAVCELLAFANECPRPLGIQWASAMEVAIRLANWTLAIGLLPEADVRDALPILFTTLVEHADHVTRHLEGEVGDPAANNHLLACLMGLQVAKTCLPDASQAGVWAGLAERFSAEFVRQVAPDGGSSEGSLAYTLLDAELALVWLVARRVDGDAAPPALADRVRAAINLIDTVAGESRRLPPIGDVDSGHVVPPLGKEGSEALADVRDLLALARRELGAGPRPMTGLRVFGDCGVVVLAGDTAQAVLEYGPVGAAGYGGHAHDDACSLTLELQGVPVLVDSGTGTYSGDYRLRDALRSAEAHNGITVGSYSQIDFQVTAPFAVTELTVSELVESTEALDVMRVAVRRELVGGRSSCRHERRLSLSDRDGWLVIDDTVEASIAEATPWVRRFHFGDARVSLEADCARVASGVIDATLTWDGGCVARLVQQPFSRAYGDVTTQQVLELTSSEGVGHVLLRFGGVQTTSDSDALAIAHTTSGPGSNGD